MLSSAMIRVPDDVQNPRIGIGKAAATGCPCAKSKHPKNSRRRHGGRRSNFSGAGIASPRGQLMAEPSRPARLWYQSFVHPTEQAPYIGRLQGELDAVAGPGIKFEVRGLD